MTWDSPDKAFRVLYQPANGKLSYFLDVTTNAALVYLAPATEYLLWVQPEGKGISEAVKVSTPKASEKREFGYRFRSASFYTSTGSPEANFFEDSSRKRVDRVEAALLAGAGEARNYYLLTDFTLNRSEQDKSMHFMLVMTPPGSKERIVVHGDMTLPGQWTSTNYAFTLNGLIRTHINNLGEMKPGRYTIDLIINGWRAGNAVLRVT